MAVGMLDKKLREADGCPASRARGAGLRLKHMIVSHHGEYEYGSPKLPMTLEAVALHHLDNLDAKLHSFEQLMRDDANVDSPWTLSAQLGAETVQRARAGAAGGQQQGAFRAGGRAGAAVIR